MATGTREEIRIGQLAIRFLVEGKDSGGSVAIFECDVPGAHLRRGFIATKMGPSCEARSVSLRQSWKIGLRPGAN
jgi:hypothetical protein